MSDCGEGDTVKRAAGESGLSDITKSTNRSQCCWLAAGCCHMTLWPVQLFEEAITWRVTSDKRRKWWREELSSRLSLLVSDRRRLLDCSHTLAYFSHLMFPSEIILTLVVYLPLRKVWIQGRPNNASQQSRGQRRNKTLLETAWGRVV